MVDASYPVYVSERVPVGHPVVGTDPATNYAVIYAHPIDSYWMAYPDDPEKADTDVQNWIQHKIDEGVRKVKTAIDEKVYQLNRFHRQRDREWDWIHDHTSWFVSRYGDVFDMYDISPSTTGFGVMHDD